MSANTCDVILTCADMAKLQFVGYHAVCFLGLMVFVALRSLLVVILAPIRFFLCLFSFIVIDASRQHDLMGNILKMLHIYLMIFILIGRFFVWLFTPVVSQPFVANLLLPFQRLVTDPLIPALMRDITKASRPSQFTFGLGMFTLVSAGYFWVQNMMTT